MNDVSRSPLSRPVIQFEVGQADGNSKEYVGFSLFFTGPMDSAGTLKINMTRSGNLSMGVRLRVS
jgi:hypothetical protein